MRNYTRELALFATKLRYEAIPEATRGRMKRHLLDSIGCAIYSTTLPHCQALLKVLALTGGKKQATIIGMAQRSSVTGAALANGTLISGFELDDVGVYVHPGACIVAAGLAAAELKGGVSGKKLLTALVLGYEITVRVSECVGPIAELEIGWHTPAFHGAIGAAACAGHIFGLDEETMLHAIAIAADLAGGGLLSARYGADVKRLHCGRAAESGILGTQLSVRGFTGTPDVLERDPWGYCSTMSYTVPGKKNYNLEKLTQALGEKFVGLERLAIKYFPIGGDQHSIVESILALKREHKIVADMVQQLTIYSTRFAFDNKLRTPASNLTTANFSARYCAAMALTHEMPPIYESADLLRLWPCKFKDPAIVALQNRIEEVVDEGLDRSNPYSVDTSVVIRLNDGREVRRMTEWVKGAPSHGTIWLRTLTDEQVEAKFLNQASFRLQRGQAEKLADKVHALETLKEVRDLTDLAHAPSSKGKRVGGRAKVAARQKKKPARQ